MSTLTCPKSILTYPKSILACPNESEPLQSTAAEEYLWRRTPGLLHGRPAVLRVDSLAEDVWEIQVEGGRKLVAKQQIFGFLASSPARDLLAVEQKVLELLRRDGCPVPRALGCDRTEQIIFMEHVGDRTLDDLVQDDAGASASSYVRQAIVGQQAIDVSCCRHFEELQPLISDAVNAQALRAAWQAACRRAGDGLAALHRHLCRETPSTRASETLEEMGRWLVSRQPLLGSTDYNARNLVVDGVTGSVSFIEFAKIGMDWTERRLVQYTTSLGSSRDDGFMHCLLDADSATFYQAHSGRRDGARALDYHYIFFLLNGAELLCSALDAARAPAQAQAEAKPRGARLLSHWRNPERRLGQFATHLTRALSADSLAASFRAELNF